MSIRESLTQHLKNTKLFNALSELRKTSTDDDIWVDIGNSSSEYDKKIKRVGDTEKYFDFFKNSWVSNRDSAEFKEQHKLAISTSLKKSWEHKSQIRLIELLDDIIDDGASDISIDASNRNIKIIINGKSPYVCKCGETGRYYSTRSKRWRCCAVTSKCQHTRMLQNDWIADDTTDECSYGCGGDAKYKKSDVYCCSSTPQSCPAVIHKIMSKNKRWKPYELPSGEIIKVQGAEDLVIDDLLNEGYSEDELVFGKTNIPVIEYIDINGKNRKHYPDIWIPSENLIIEVKSDFTFKIDKENNLLKQKAAVQSGYNYEFKIKSTEECKRKKPPALAEGTPFYSYTKGG